MPLSEPLVCLQRGFVVPAVVFNLVLECERLGIQLSARNGTTLDVDGPHTPELLELLKAWKPHVILVLRYTSTDTHLRDETIPRPHLGPIQQVSK